MATIDQRTLATSREYNQSRVSLTTNSTRSQRITRKRDTSHSGSRNRSRSRDQNQDQDFQTYLKQLKTSKTPQNHLQRSLELLKKSQCSNPKEEEESSKNHISSFKRIRPSVIDQNNSQNLQKRKRQPTPVKSRRDIRRDVHQDSKNQKQNFQLELRVAELENQLNIQKALRLKFSDAKLSLQKTVQHLKEVLSQLEIENKILLGEKKSYEQKMKQMESTILESEKDLTITKNKLNKLKETIKQNKMSQLQAQANKLKKVNELQRQKVSKLEVQKRTLFEELAKSSKQIQELSRKVQLLEVKADRQSRAWRESTREQFLSKQVDRLKKSLQNSKQERQKFIEEKLSEKDEIVFNLKNEIKNLKIQIHFLQQNKEKQVNQIKNSKETQLKKLRIKCSKLVNELRNKDTNKSRNKLCKDKERKENFYPSRSSIMERTSHDSISLSLSPEDHK